jgi:hypothetical protein
MTMTENTAKLAKPAKKRVSARQSKPRRRSPDCSEIAERAYFIHIDEGRSDELENWLRAERELTAA